MLSLVFRVHDRSGIKLPLHSIEGENSVEIDWGDGTKNLYNLDTQSDSGPEHFYTQSGKYIMTISKGCGDGNLKFGYSGYIKGKGWAGIQCLVGVGSYISPRFTNLSGMFCNATNFNDPNICNWDTSNVTNIGGMFWNAKMFNQPIGTWDTSKVTNMCCMFQEMKRFNKSLNNWNIDKLIYMSYIFSRALSFKKENISNCGY